MCVRAFGLWISYALLTVALGVCQCIWFWDILYLAQFTFLSCLGDVPRIEMHTVDGSNKA